MSEWSTGWLPEEPPVDGQAPAFVLLDEAGELVAQWIAPRSEPPRAGTLVVAAAMVEGCASVVGVVPMRLGEDPFVFVGRWDAGGGPGRWAARPHRGGAWVGPWQDGGLFTVGGMLNGWIGMELEGVLPPAGSGWVALALAGMLGTTGRTRMPAEGSEAWGFGLRMVEATGCVVNDEVSRGLAERMGLRDGVPVVSRTVPFSR